MENVNLSAFRAELLDELESNILPYWIDKMQDNEHGGFYGRIDGNENLIVRSSKGAILNARILWTFSAAYRLLKKPVYGDMARRAAKYLMEEFCDRQYGGVFWELDFEGNPLNTKKQIYALGFAIYGLSEYYRISGDGEALEMAISLFRDIERHSFDQVNNGYREAFARDWSEIGDVRLSDKDENENKTMNTHLHILEPYTNLYRVWPDEELKAQIINLVNIFAHKIYDPRSGHLNLFFDDDWQARHRIISYGHDIEASWLIDEALRVIGDESLYEMYKPFIIGLAEATHEGVQPEGNLIYECHLDTLRKDRESHWWVQAENVVGNFNLYELTRKPEALDIAWRTWGYIKENLIDRHYGEWYWSRYEDGRVNTTDDKAGFWKCPYHNSRMCMELIMRIGE